MRLGIGSWTFPWAIGIPGYPQPPEPLTAAGLLDKAAELGVRLVQFADNLPLDPLGPAEIERLSARARDLSVGVELGTRGVEPERLLRYLELCRRLGSPLLRTLADPDLERTAAAIGQVLPAFESSGVAIALENYEAHTTRELSGLVRRVNSPALGICLDTVNSLGALETPEQAASELAPHVLNLHVKDFDIIRVPSRMGFSVVGRPAGEGRLDVPRLLAEIRRHGRDPSVILELWPPFCDALEAAIRTEEDWAKRSIGYLKGLA